MAQKAVGIDIGGTGIKGAIVDVESGELLTDRIKKPTPEGGEPDAIVAVVKQIVDELGLEVGKHATAVVKSTNVIVEA